MVQTVEKTSKNQRNEVKPNRTQCKRRARGAVEGAHYSTLSLWVQVMSQSKN